MYNITDNDRTFIDKKLKWQAVQIDNQNILKKNNKRVSFFVDEKICLRFKKYQSLNDFYSPNSFLKQLLQNYANNQ